MNEKYASRAPLWKHGLSRSKQKFGLVLAAFLAAATLFGPAPSASPLIGVASVIDGDTIEIRGTRIRLHGIDAPESSQLCTRPEGERWRCGQRAAFALSDYIGSGTVECEPRGLDRYRRVLAVCFLRGEDLNGWLVSSGWALAFRRYSLDYVEQENAARQSRLGVWSGTFEPPWEWRSGRRNGRN